MDRPHPAPLLRDDRDGVATLRLNRPSQFNALSEALLDALQRELAVLAGDPHVRCVVLAAEGRAFCAGHDLREMRGTPDLAYYRGLFGQCSRVMQAIRALPVPVVARVHGIATAAGCQLVASCDLAIAADTARFAVSGINVGLFCSTPAVALSRNVSAKRAFDMLVTGRFIDAATAVDWGSSTRRCRRTRSTRPSPARSRRSHRRARAPCATARRCSTGSGRCRSTTRMRTRAT